MYHFVVSTAMTGKTPAKLIPTLAHIIHFKLVCYTGKEERTIFRKYFISESLSVLLCKLIKVSGNTVRCVMAYLLLKHYQALLTF